MAERLGSRADRRTMAPTGDPQHYTVVPDRSAILVNVSTSLGPVAFGATGVQGFVEALVDDGRLDLSAPPAAHLELQVSRLTSGNSAYDGELRRHIAARRFPAAYFDLHRVSRAGGSGTAYAVTGEVTFRGVSESTEGTVAVECSDTGTLVISGREALDIRVFDIPPPTLFMMKIEPEVTLSLHLEARPGAVA